MKLCANSRAAFALAWAAIFYFSAQGAYAEDEVEAPEVASKKEILKDLDREFQRFSEDAKNYSTEADLTFDSRMSAYRGKINQFFERDIIRLSKNEFEDRELMFRRIRDLYSKLPEVEEKPDLLLKLQYLSFEIITEKYLSAQERYEEDYRRFSAGKALRPPEEPNKNYGESIAYGEALQKFYPQFRQLDKSLYLLGYAQTEMNKPQEAVKAFFQLVQRFPESQYVTEANLRIGEYYFDEELYAQSLPYYELVRSSSDRRFYEKALYKMGWIYYKLNESFRSADTFFQLVSYLDENPAPGAETIRSEARQFIAAMFAEMDDGLNQARAYFAQRRFQKREYQVYRMMGDYYAEVSEFERAAAVYTFLFQSFPLETQNLKSHEKLLGIYFNLDRHADYFKEIDRFITTYDINTPWYRAQSQKPEIQALARAAVDSYSYKKVLHMHQLAQKSKAPKDYWTASIAYREFIKKFPYSPNSEDANFRYANTLYFAGKYDWSAIEYEYVLSHTENKEMIASSVNGLIQSYENLIKSRRGTDRRVAGVVEPLVDPSGKPLPPRPLLEEEETMAKKLEMLSSRSGIPADLKALVLYKQGELYYRNNHFEKSRPLFTRIVDEYTSNPLAVDAAKMNLESYRLEAKWDDVEYWSKKLLSLSTIHRGIASAEVNRLISNSLFKKAEELQTAGKTDEAIKEYHRLVKEQPKAEVAPKALYNAALLLDQQGKQEAAVKDLTRIQNAYSKDALFSQATFLKGTIQDSMFDVNSAESSYQALVRSAPKNQQPTQQTLDSMYRLALISEAKRNPAQAAYWYESYAQARNYKDDSRKALIDAFERYDKAGRAQDAYRVEQQYTKHYPDDVDRKLYFMSRRYERLVRTRPDEAQKLADQTKAFLKKNQKAELLSDTRAAVGSLLLRDLRPKLKRYGSTHLQLPQERLAVTLKLKTDLQQSLEQELTEIIGLGDPLSAVRALLVLGEVYSNFAAEFYNPPIPSGLSSEEKELYKAELQKQAYPIDDKAALAFQQAVDSSIKYKQPAAVVNMAKKKLSKYRPQISPEPMDWPESGDSLRFSYRPRPVAQVVQPEGDE